MIREACYDVRQARCGEVWRLMPKKLQGGVINYRKKARGQVHPRPPAF